MVKRRLSEAERRIWRKVARTITPLNEKPVEKAPEAGDFGALLDGKKTVQAVTKTSSNSATTTPPAKTSIPKPAPLAEAVNTTKKPASGPLADRGKERRVRRGQTTIDGKLDLHGHTQDGAKAALYAFLSHHRHMGDQCVLVITGKGRLGGGVLRKHFLDWLHEGNFRLLVSSYAQAHQKHGGTGAFYVFLRRK